MFKMAKLSSKILIAVLLAFLAGLLFNVYARNFNKSVNSKTFRSDQVFRKRTVKKLFDLRIIVLVYDRAKSLLRLLESLNDAEYSSDDIKLEVWIDRSEKGDIDNITLQTATHFTFRHGEFEVQVHPRHVGIMGQWLTTWKPPENNSDEIAVILEDDVTVSKYFWRYLKMVHRKYDNRPDVNGYSLQGYSITFSTNHPITTLRGPKNSTVFLFPVVGSWGFSPSTENWKKFLDWFANQETDTFKPYVPGNIASRWFESLSKRGKAKTMWTMWHIYYAWKNREFTLRCNFPGE